MKISKYYYVFASSVLFVNLAAPIAANATTKEQTTGQATSLVATSNSTAATPQNIEGSKKIAEIFPDAAFAKVILKNMQDHGYKGTDVSDEVTQEDLNNYLKHNLAASGAGITSIEGIQYLHNLGWPIQDTVVGQVMLDGNNIKDLSPLANFDSPVAGVQFGGSDMHGVDFSPLFASPAYLNHKAYDYNKWFMVALGECNLDQNDVEKLLSLRAVNQQTMYTTQLQLQGNHFDNFTSLADNWNSYANPGYWLHDQTMTLSPIKITSLTQKVEFKNPSKECSASNYGKPLPITKAIATVTDNDASGTEAETIDATNHASASWTATNIQGKQYLRVDVTQAGVTEHNVESVHYLIPLVWDIQPDPEPTTTTSSSSDTSETTSSSSDTSETTSSSSDTSETTSSSSDTSETTSSSSDTSETTSSSSDTSEITSSSSDTSETTSSSSDTSETTNSTGTTSSSNQVTPAHSDSSNRSDKKTLPQTGEKTTSIESVIGMSLLAGIGFYLFRKKEQNRE
ncbi:LPXTG cell wall anchor domain-containing protein [Vagococcus entomophilus]|uniref:LPXTG cell wall anchor domain-containing protein n=1 Tax=Vagococcus entomophilus TaxID=1160095 RepID=UPI0035EA129C